MLLSRVFVLYNKAKLFECKQQKTGSLPSPRSLYLAEVLFLPFRLRSRCSICSHASLKLIGPQSMQRKSFILRQLLFFFFLILPECPLFLGNWFSPTLKMTLCLFCFMGKQINYLPGLWLGLKATFISVHAWRLL